MILKSLVIWLLIALAETANGMVRVRLLSRRLGNRRARAVSLLTGCFLIFIITWLALPWVGPDRLGDALLIGLISMVLMVAYDVGIGRWVFRMKWRTIIADFDLRRGNYLALGMLWILIAPVSVFLVAMQDHAAQLLAQTGHIMAPKALLLGFSASGQFANRYTFLHSGRVLAAAIGAPGGWPIAPVRTWKEHALSYAVGWICGRK